MAGTATQRLTPAQIGTENVWVFVEGGRDHSIASKSDGTIWAWGWNGYGQLGDETISHKYSPVQVTAPAKITKPVQAAAPAQVTKPVQTAAPAQAAAPAQITDCVDKDADGYGNPGSASCPNGSATDCNDNDGTINPGAADILNNNTDDDCNPDTPGISVSGNAYNYPVPLFRAGLSLSVNSSALSTSYLNYYYARNVFSFISTSIASVTAAGGIATVTGTGKVNGVDGCSFKATVNDGAPDAMGIAITPGGACTTSYNADTQSVTSGNLTVAGE
ncbi:MAG: hypothetical protein HY759_05945 [Nitrospirae bacterium]|nr:hypothetical protein [Nitrospirota bacterium]